MIFKIIRFFKDVKRLRNLNSLEDFGPAWDCSKLNIIKRLEEVKCQKM